MHLSSAKSVVSTFLISLILQIDRNITLDSLFVSSVGCYISLFPRGCRSRGGTFIGLKENQSNFPGGARNAQLLGASWLSHLPCLGISLVLRATAWPGRTKRGGLTFEPSNDVLRLPVMTEKDKIK